MESDKTATRAKMSLLRQKQVSESSEKTPLIRHECETDDNQVAKEIKDKPEYNLQATKAVTNKGGQSVVTLHRGLLMTQWTSTASASDTTSQSPNDSNDEKESTPISKSDCTKGILLAIIGAGVMYGLTAVFVRLAGDNGVGSAETLFVRCGLQFILFGSLGAIRQISFFPPEGKAWYCLLIAVTYSLATITSFEAFNVIPPGNAIATRGASRTIFAVLLSFLIMREKLFWKDLIAVVTCVAGISCIIASSLSPNNNDYVVPQGLSDNRVLVNVYGYMLIVCSGISRSVGMITVRQLKGELHSFTIVGYHSLLTFLISFVLLFVRKLSWPPTPAGVGYILAVCVTSSVATWSSNRAVQLIHPALVALGQNADLVVSMVLEHTILHMAPSMLEILGACLILGGVSGITWLKWKASRENAEIDSNAK
ncbi:unnamed protein product [Clavelina lepadiformis]|uniref:EamA domain-containing protein n=1 Tax=Clavelina lepadiformis TaxID=159417 RepID=A0ABP0FGG2_CLALP